MKTNTTPPTEIPAIATIDGIEKAAMEKYPDIDLTKFDNATDYSPVYRDAFIAGANHLKQQGWKSHEEVEAWIKTAVSKTIGGMMTWLESDSTWVQDKDTKQVLPNTEIEANCGPFDKYIEPLLEKGGIKFKF